ncbi:MAG: hypothetical protein QME79_14890 [Bacillota bacterium]|nr:hypothetical protein [Bacillota bacterium]
MTQIERLSEELKAISAKIKEFRDKLASLPPAVSDDWAGENADGATLEDWLNSVSYRGAITALENEYHKTEKLLRLARGEDPNEDLTKELLGGE